MRSVKLLAFTIFILVSSSIILRNLALVLAIPGTTEILFAVSYILISPLSFIPIYLSYRPVDLAKEYKKLFYVPFLSSILAVLFVIVALSFSSQFFNQERLFYPSHIRHLQSVIFLIFDMVFITFTAMFIACMGEKDAMMVVEKGRGFQIISCC